MPHPIMFRDDDLGLAELRDIALGFPEAFEKISHGRPVFCAPKMFAMYGGSSKATRRGEYLQFPHSMLVKVDESATAGRSSRTPASSTPRTWVRRAGSGWTSPPRRGRLG